MPYANPTKQREAQKEWWRDQYQGDPKFRRSELRRKKVARAGWSEERREENREYMREFMRRYRKRKRREKKVATKRGRKK
jgi:hypothetical protein